MPYIKKENRPPMDEIVNKMLGLRVRDQDLCYITFEFCVKHVSPSYNNYKNYIGELTEICAELERRFGVTPDDYSIDWVIDKPRVKELSEVLKMMVENNVKVNGDLNYILFKYIRYHSDEDYMDGMSSALIAVTREIRERILGPYEEEKAEENGDV